MKCEYCHGTGWVPGVVTDEDARGIKLSGEDFWHYMKPCEECGGTGISHCCDGLREQPEEE